MRSGIKIAAFAIAMLASVGSAHAVTASELMAKCSDVVNAQRWSKSGQVRINFDATQDSMFCWGVFEVIQAAAVIKSARGGDTLLMCIPDGVTRWQLVSVFNEFARENPKLLHHDAAVVAFFAMEAAFPCETLNEVAK